MKALDSLVPFIGITRLLHSAITKLPCVGELLVYRGVQGAKNKLDKEYAHGLNFQWAQFPVGDFA